MMSDKVKQSIAVALKQLHVERSRIEGAIARLEGVLDDLVTSATTSVKRRGRPPGSGKSSSQAPAAVKKTARARRIIARQRSREGWTDDARKAAAERMRRYWADRHKAAGEGKQGSVSRRGRKSSGDGLQATAANDSRERSRKGWTEEARLAARERMRRYWENRKNADAVSG